MDFGSCVGCRCIILITPVDGACSDILGGISPLDCIGLGPLLCLLKAPHGFHLSVRGEGLTAGRTVLLSKHPCVCRSPQISALLDLIILPGNQILLRFRQTIPPALFGLSLGNRRRELRPAI